jgi:hypothetical protein
LGKGCAINAGSVAKAWFMPRATHTLSKRMLQVAPAGVLATGLSLRVFTFSVHESKPEL